jgi:biopolymer transport protein ExbD
MSITIHKGLSAGTLNLTPLVDVVFLLLIFFLVATQFEQEERDLEVQLAQASQIQPTTAEREDIFVTITPEGNYYVAGERLDARRLRAVLQDAAHANPGRQRVTIRADQDSRTRHVVTVMDACQQAAIRNYSLATE